MKLATTTGDFSRYTEDQAEAVKYIREAGFRYIDYSFNLDYKRQNGFFGEDPAAHLAKMKEAAKANGVCFVQAHAPMGDPIKEGNIGFSEATARCIEAAAALGIPNIVIHTGYETGLSREETFERNAAFFRPLLALADRLNITLLAENFNKMCVDGLYWIDNATDLLAFIEFVNHPRLQAVLDAGHDNMQKTTRGEAVRLLGTHLRALHVQDNPGGDDSHMMPFYGTLDIDSLMEGLLEVGYKGYFTFESSSMMKRYAPKDLPADAPPLARPPLSLRIAEEKLLYEIGKTILSTYGCFEE